MICKSSKSPRGLKKGLWKEGKPEPQIGGEDSERESRDRGETIAASLQNQKLKANWDTPCQLKKKKKISTRRGENKKKIKGRTEAGFCPVMEGIYLKTTILRLKRDCKSAVQS